MDGFKPMVKMKCGGSVSKAVEKAKMCFGGETKKYKEGGKTDLAQDKALIKKAISQHDKQEHPGEKTELKLKQGGRSKKAVGTVKKFAKGGAIEMKKTSGDKDTIKKVKATGAKKAAAPSKAATKPKASPKKMADGGALLDQGLQNQSIAAAAQPAQVPIGRVQNQSVAEPQPAQNRSIAALLPAQVSTMDAQNAITNALQNFKMPNFRGQGVDPATQAALTMMHTNYPNAADNTPAPYVTPRAITPDQIARQQQSAQMQQAGINTRLNSSAQQDAREWYSQQRAALKAQRDTGNTGPNAGGARALIDYGNNMNALDAQMQQKLDAINAKYPITNGRVPHKADGGPIDLMQGQGAISDSDRNLMQGQGPQSANAYDRFKQQNPNAKRGMNRKQIEALINSPAFQQSNRNFTDR